MRSSPLRRRKPLANGGTVTRRKPAGYGWRRAEEDKVSPGLRQLVLARDGRCMAPVLDPDLSSPCKDNWGSTLRADSYSVLQHVLELDHVPDQAAMSVRATSDAEHLVVLCPYHHRLSGWATSKRGRELERQYLRSLRSVDKPVLPTSMEQP